MGFLVSGWCSTTFECTRTLLFGKVLASAEKIVAWPTRIQFVEALAALAAARPEDMGRKLEGTKLTDSGEAALSAHGC